MTFHNWRAICLMFDWKDRTDVQKGSLSNNRVAGLIFGKEKEIGTEKRRL